MPDQRSILIVDDAADIRLLARTVLSRAGWHVSEATRGSEVPGALADTLPDVVLLDVQMPDQDGWVTLASIRRDPRSAHLPVVLCTVKAAREDRERGWRLGCDGFLTKPFAIDHLVDEVTAVASRSSPERIAVRREQLETLANMETSQR